MNSLLHSYKYFNKIQEAHQIWNEKIACHFPADFEQIVKNSGLFVRKRGIKSASDLLKIMFLFATTKLSFRMLALAASLLSVASISDTAWRKKFLASTSFLHSLLISLLQTTGIPSNTGDSHHKNVYLVDASTIRQDGTKHAQYRIHTCYDLNKNQICQI